MVSITELKQFKHRINPTEETEGRGNFGYYVIRPISLYFTWMFLQTRIRANQVTLMHMGMGIIGSILLAFPSAILQLGGCFLLYVGFVLDNVDGEVARYRGEVSITGKYIDTIAHVVVNSLMFFCFGVGAYWDTGSIFFIILGFLSAFFSLRLDTFVMYTEAAKSFKQNLDSKYKYYANIEGRLTHQAQTDLEFISKRASTRLKRGAFAVFAYPGSLHIMTASLLVSLGAGFGAPSWMRYLPAVVIAVYGILLTGRRVLTIRGIITRNDTEAQLVEMRKR